MLVRWCLSATTLGRVRGLPASRLWANGVTFPALDGLVVQADGEERVLAARGGAADDLGGVRGAGFRPLAGKRQRCSVLVSGNPNLRGISEPSSHSVSARHPHVRSFTQVFDVCLLIRAQSCLLLASSTEGPSVGLGVKPFTPSWADACVCLGRSCTPPPPRWSSACPSTPSAVARRPEATARSHNWERMVGADRSARRLVRWNAARGGVVELSLGGCEGCPEKKT